MLVLNTVCVGKSTPSSSFYTVLLFVISLTVPVFLYSTSREQILPRIKGFIGYTDTCMRVEMHFRHVQFKNGTAMGSVKHFGDHFKKLWLPRIYINLTLSV